LGRIKNVTKLRLLFTAAAVVGFLSCLPAASAQTHGVLDLTACGGGGIQVTLTDIFFVTTSSANRGCAVTGAATNLVTTTLGTVGPNLAGEVLNLNVTVCGIFTMPGCVVPDFIRLTSQPNLHFDLSLIGPGPHSATCSSNYDPYEAPCGVFLAAPPQLPYDSPFFLLPTTTGLSINLPLFGQVRENDTVVGSFNGTLSTQEVGISAAGFQKLILTGGKQQSTYALSLVVTPVPSIASGGIVNAGSNQGTDVAPGEIVTIYGSNLSPVSTPLQLLPNGKVSTLGAGTAVLFDGIPAPLIYASPTQVSAVAPYEVTSATKVQVLQSLVVSSNVVSEPVAATAPGIFTVSGAGTGQIYVTGEGVTSPAGVDGVPTSLTAPGKPVANVTVTIGGVTATAVAVEAPGVVAGVLQVNATVPTTAASGAADPVVVTIGGVQAQSGVTMAVQ
jgi:hypothetical protein